MKALKLIVFIGLLPFQLHAESIDTAAMKASFENAKLRLENMLAGKEKMSYEEAIFQIENAWWSGSINYTSFKNSLRFHENNVRKLIKTYEDSVRLDPERDLLHTSQEKKAAYQQAFANFAIFSYITQTSLLINHDSIIYHQPFIYSTDDPLATANWTNTHVTHLINFHSGNCFALASLYKILSERLHSDAALCTAPGHIYIRHIDDKGAKYNVELASGSFPGTGTIETVTYTPTEATKNNIALRELDLRQSIALCLVYLAKGYEYKFGIKDDAFMLSCAEAALIYDDHNLNAMLLKAEILEERLTKQNIEFSRIQKEKTFIDYQNWIAKIFLLGYREMPYEMKNLLIKGWTRDTLIQLASADHTPSRLKHPTLKDTRYAGLSWGLFDEEIRTKPLEIYGNTVFDTKSKKIVAFLQDDILYNQYNFDPVVFAWNVDPLAHEFPWQSPYTAFDNSPIWKNDPTGKSGEIVIDKQSKTATVSMNVYVYGSRANTALAKSTARDIQNLYNSANATVKIGNETYKVQFDVKGRYLGNGGDVMEEAAIAGKIFNNTDVRNNFFRVEDQASQSGGESFATLLGNDGMFNLSEISGNGSTTEAHEGGHGLGLKHNNSGSWQARILGKPDLMDNRNDIVSDKYKKGYALSDGTLDVNKRKVSQRNINGIFTPAVVGELQKSGKAAVGTTTNTYYLPNGTGVNKP